MDETKKGKQADISGLSDGLKELADIPSEKKAEPQAMLIAPASIPQVALLPEHSSSEQTVPSKPDERPKTQKEQDLDVLINQRQSVIEQLKAKNPLVAQARQQLAELIPSIRGKGSSRVMELVREEERLEFSIATEAYTPKNEKELLKRLREIHAELATHKELDAARKKVDEQRSVLRNAISEIKALERQLAEARQKCDEKYSEVLAERKSAYEQRQKNRDNRKQKQSDDLHRRMHEDRRQEYDSEVQKYMKDYDDTVSMEEIVQFEKKEKKKSD